jgi:hypothetical protein
MQALQVALRLSRSVNRKASINPESCKSRRERLYVVSKEVEKKRNKI